MILVNGCSHTHGNNNAIEGNYLDQTWGFQVGKHLNMDVTNIAQNGVGCEYIVRTTMQWIMKHGNPDMVLIGWPYHNRFEYPLSYREYFSTEHFGLTKYTNGKVKYPNDKEVGVGGYGYPFVPWLSSNYVNGLQLIGSKNQHTEEDEKIWGGALGIMYAKKEQDNKSLYTHLYKFFTEKLEVDANTMRWFIEKKLYHMVLLAGWLKSRNIKYYWYSNDDIKHEAVKYGLKEVINHNSPDNLSFLGQKEELEEPIYFDEYFNWFEDLNLDGEFIQYEEMKGLGPYDHVTGLNTLWYSKGLMPGWFRRYLGPKEDKIEYIDNHMCLDWHEWFGKAFAHFIKTGNRIDKKIDYEKMEEEFTKAAMDPNRDPSYGNKTEVLDFLSLYFNKKQKEAELLHGNWNGAPSPKKDIVGPIARTLDTFIYD